MSETAALREALAACLRYVAHTHLCATRNLARARLCDCGYEDNERAARALLAASPGMPPGTFAYWWREKGIAKAARATTTLEMYEACFTAGKESTR